MQLVDYNNITEETFLLCIINNKIMINKKSHLIILSLFVFCFSCTNKTNDDSYELKNSGKITLQVDKNTYYFSKAIFLYTDTKTGKEYLTFENDNSIDQEILFWDIESGKLVKRIKINKEGPNRINMFGHYVKSWDSIYVTNINRAEIYLINKDARILQTISYEKDTDNNPLWPSPAASIMYQPLILINNSFYLTNRKILRTMGSDDWAKMPLCAKINNVKLTVSLLPLKYPILWKEKSPIANDINIESSREYDGKNFIYAFTKRDSIIVTKDHVNSKNYNAKSRYLDEVKCIPQAGTDIMSEERATCEQGMYWHFIYDKYRDVYYRFAFLPCELEANDNPMDVELHRQKFSVIILNNKFEVIGETLFPKDKFSPKMFFVGKKGLYISESNPKNYEFDENKLVFSCFTLTRKDQ